jgi:hypothetical protein
MILVVKIAGCYVVPLIPIHVTEATIISLVLYDSLFRDLESILILVVAVTETEGAFG